MSTELANLTALVPAFTPEQMNLITNTIAKGASKDELQLFLYRCKNMGLDPLKPGQIHFVKYGNGPGTIVVGIEGFRSIAHRTGKLSGIERGVTKDEKGVLVSAWAKVYRSDWQHPAREEVPFAEYNTGRGPWLKMPETMLKKCAEAATLRMAFPDDLGGVYESAEMDQASGPIRVVADQPAEGDGHPAPLGGEGEWRFPGGKHNTKKLSELSPDEHRIYIEKTEAYFQKIKKPLPAWWTEYLSIAEPLVATFENEEPGAQE